MLEKIETEWYEKIALFRVKALKPLLRLLTSLHIKPDYVSYFGALLMLAFIALIKINLYYALAALLLAAFSDLVDGALARYQKVDCDKGKFTDMTIDSLDFTLFVIALIFAGVLNGLLGTILVYFMLLDKVLLVILKNLHKRSDWLIHAKAGFYPNLWVFLSYLLFSIHVFYNLNTVIVYNLNYFDVAAILFTVALIINATHSYWKAKNETLSKK